MPAANAIRILEMGTIYNLGPVFSGMGRAQNVSFRCGAGRRYERSGSRPLPPGSNALWFAESFEHGRDLGAIERCCGSRIADRQALSLRPTLDAGGERWLRERLVDLP